MNENKTEYLRLTNNVIGTKHLLEKLPLFSRLYYTKISAIEIHDIEKHKFVSEIIFSHGMSDWGIRSQL